MKKYQIIFTIIVWLFLIIKFYLETAPSQKNSTVYLEDLNKSLVNFQELLFIPTEKIYPNDFMLWDMKISKLLKDRKKRQLLKNKKKLQTKKVNKSKEQNIKVKYRTICVEKKCWQLMGIININGIKTLTLLSKEKKSKLQIFKVGEELLPKILIKEIKGESMILLNKEKNKEIILKLFDVDISQYLPKTVKEKNE